MATEVDRLMVVFDANITRLEEKLNKVIRANHAAAAKVDAAWRAKADKKSGPVGALKAGFDDLAESAGGVASQLPGVGVALTRLGPAGIAAAVGVTALIVAFRQAAVAAKFADELSDTADKLHITTDALQEYQYALRAAGGEEADVAAALADFTTKLGDAEAGTKKGLRAFRMLFGEGFTKEDARNLGGAEAAIMKITEALQGMSAAQKNAALKRFGLEGMAQLLELPLEQVRALIQESHTLGNVMDRDVIDKGAELNKEFEDLHKKIKVDLAEAFLELGPALIPALKGMARLIELAGDVVDAFDRIENKRRATIIRQMNAMIFRQARGAQGGYAAVVAKFYEASDREKIAAFQAELADRDAKEAARDKELADEVKGSGEHLESGDTDKPARKVRDEFTPRANALDRDLARLEVDLLRAMEDLTRTADDRAKLQLQILDAERAEANRALDAEAKEIMASDAMDGAQKHELILQLEAIRLKEGELDAARRRAVETERVEANADAALRLSTLTLTAEEEALSLAGSLARTAKERREVELKLLDLADRRLRLEQDRIIKDSRSTPEDRAEAEAKLRSMEETRAGREAVIRQGNLGPWDQMISELPQGIDEVNERFEALAAEGIRSVTDGLANVIAGTASLKDVFRNTITQMIADLARLQLQKTFMDVVSAIGGTYGDNTMGARQTKLAAGTLSSRHGMALVGERGPELVNLPGGSQVITNAALRNAAIGGQGGGATVITFDNRGAVIWEQAARQMMSYADRAAAASGLGAVQVSRVATPTDMARRGGRRLGR